MTTTASALQSQYDDPWDALADMHTRLEEKDDRIEEQNEKIEELRGENQNQAERIDELEAELENQSTNIGGAFAKLSAIDDRLEAVEKGGADVDSDPDPNADDDAQDESNRTPLEQICSLPEDVAQRELTANQIRARFVAKDVTDYAQSVPAGYRIDTTTMRKVLSANPDDDGTIHRTTTKRVMKFLDRFGDEEVTVRKQRDGRNSVVFTEDLIDRLERSDVCNGESTNGALLTA